VLGVVLVFGVEHVLMQLVLPAGEEGVHFGGGEGLVARVGGDAEGLAEEHCLWEGWAVSRRPVRGS